MQATFSKKEQDLNNKKVASSIDLNLFSKTEFLMKPDEKGTFHLDQANPNYKRWIEE